ncbi:MAG: hypothetical protein GY789_07030 [Hyphomicrobiales bacterium]|nr:hypothetical protein [Hyphomicrobiales bacterium]MCP5001888.1 hypothetical protein [Hyphomicrobiales bacterium]
MAILDYPADIWREALDIAPGEEPAALILEGTWWRESATKNRLSKLSDVRELAFPEMFAGTWNGALVIYCCAYGAARAIEPAHIFAQLGTPLLIQLGTCGTLDVNASTGMVILPDIVAARDGVSQYYGVAETVQTDPQWVKRAERLLCDRDVQTQRGYHLTWPSLFAQSDEMCDAWIAEKLLSIDMETSAVVAAADYYGVSAVSMLTVWDALPHGRTFLDPLEPQDAERLKRSNQEIYDVALQLARRAEDLRNA